jgi:hypothetical protein
MAETSERGGRVTQRGDQPPKLGVRERWAAGVAGRVDGRFSTVMTAFLAVLAVSLFIAAALDDDAFALAIAVALACFALWSWERVGFKRLLQRRSREIAELRSYSRSQDTIGLATCPSCGTQVNWFTREGVHCPDDHRPWACRCDVCDSEVPVETP